MSTTGRGRGDGGELIEVTTIKDGEVVVEQVKMYSVHVVAELLGVTSSTVIKWSREGVIPAPCLRMAGGRRLYTTAVVEMMRKLRDLEGKR